MVLPLAFLAACSTSQVLVPHRVELDAAHAIVPESDRLDVGIALFDPGVPAGDIEKDVLEELLEDGVFVSIRRAESIQMAVRLRDALQQSGHWGTVWVAPEASPAADLNVDAKIIESDGYLVSVAVTAVDATGRTWLDEHYELEIAAAAYDRRRYPDLDPYQDLFNAIANDLAALRAQLSSAEAERVKTVAALRYAGGLSPEAFGGYVEERHDGFVPVRLPARDDPMFERTQLVRQRELLFFETLDQHYEQLVSDAEASYTGWRASAREESLAIREMTRTARWRAALGAAAIVGALASGGGAGAGADFVRNGLMSIGGELFNSRAQNLQGRELHSAVLEELSESFDSEIEPMVVEIAGVQHRLTGTAALQYQELRRLLRRLFIAETGLPAADAAAPPDPAALDAAVVP